MFHDEDRSDSIYCQTCPFKPIQVIFFPEGGDAPSIDEIRDSFRGRQNWPAITTWPFPCILFIHFNLLSGSSQTPHYSRCRQAEIRTAARSRQNFSADQMSKLIKIKVNIRTAIGHQIVQADGFFYRPNRTRVWVAWQTQISDIGIILAYFKTHFFHAVYFHNLLKRIDLTRQAGGMSCKKPIIEHEPQCPAQAARPGPCISWRQRKYVCARIFHGKQEQRHAVNDLHN